MEISGMKKNKSNEDKNMKKGNKVILLTCLLVA